MVLSRRQVAEIEHSAWFQTASLPYALFDAGMRIRGANNAFERATGHPRSYMIGKLAADVFPDNPADPHADGVANMARSVDFVFRRGVRHSMGLQRYDVPDPDRPGEFNVKYWAPVNSPLKEGGKTVAVLHQTHDVTRALLPNGHRQHLDVDDLRRAAHDLSRRFPGVPAEELLGVLSHSHLVVLDSIGALDAAKAEELTAMRLEARTGVTSLR